MSLLCVTVVCHCCVSLGTRGLAYQCCGDNRYFDPSVATCCRGNQQEGTALRFRCCRQRSFDPSVISGPAACCESTAYDTDQQVHTTENLYASSSVIHCTSTKSAITNTGINAAIAAIETAHS